MAYWLSGQRTGTTRCRTRNCLLVSRDCRSRARAWAPRSSAEFASL